MTLKPQFPVGKVVGLHGLAGEIKVAPSTNTPELLLSVRCLTIRLSDGRKSQASVSSMRLAGCTLIMRLAEFSNRSQAERIMNAELYVEPAQLRPLEPEQYWVSDLIGLKAFTISGEFVGTVVSVIDAGNHILELNCGSAAGTILVPFVEAIVPVVDIPAGRIEIDPIPGLLEPQR